MSKQSEAREKQGYRHEGPRCGTCKNFTSDMVPVAWMVKVNAEWVERGGQPPYDITLPVNQREGNLRCGVGGFSIKKNAYCSKWEEQK